MGKKAKKRRRKPAVPSKETKAVDSLTVAWMLAVMTALLCEVAGTVAKIMGEDSANLQLAAGYLLFAAAVIGGISLIMLLFVLRLRTVRPPSGIIFFAVVVGAAPILVMLFSWLQKLG